MPDTAPPATPPTDHGESQAVEYEYTNVRSDDAAKWIGRDGWERHIVTLRRAKPLSRMMHGRSRSGLTVSEHVHPWEPDCDERGCVEASLSGSQEAQR